MGDASAAEPPPVVQWYVLIEETLSVGQGQRWGLSEHFPADSLEHARKRAENLAFDYQPRHPMTPRSRTVFRSNADSWLVKVRGAMHDYHFRVTVAEWL